MVNVFIFVFFVVNLTPYYIIILICTCLLNCNNLYVGNLLAVLFVNLINNIEIYLLFSLVEEPSLWVGSDRDYTYDELLVRVFNIMREKNPDMVAGKKQKFVMRPPQVVRIGTKKTSFANFTEVII